MSASRVVGNMRKNSINGKPSYRSLSKDFGIDRSLSVDKSAEENCFTDP